MRRLFALEERFPPAAYTRDPALLGVLREVGLRGLDDIDPEDVREAANVIENLAASMDLTRDQALAVCSYISS